MVFNMGSGLKLHRMVYKRINVCPALKKISYLIYDQMEMLTRLRISSASQMVNKNFIKVPGKSQYLCVECMS